jgi:integrase/recombinase XerD
MSTSASQPDQPTGVRDVCSLVLPMFGEVVEMASTALPWRVTSLPDAGDKATIDGFLEELVARDCSPLTVRSYAFAILRWWRFLAAIAKHWTSAEREDVRDLVLWLRQARGGAGYAPATVNHQLAVISAFYDALADRGDGPVMNPVPRPPGRRHAHHNPLEEFRVYRRAPYRQRCVDVGPGKALTDDFTDRLFAQLVSNRDRALVALYLASGVRASELLGMTGADVDWGGQMIGVVRKGTRAYQQVPTSPDALTWLRLYLSDGFEAAPDEPLWWTLREPRRPLQYTAMRAVLRRVTAALGEHATLHSFRHTCATRLANDPQVPLTDVQAVLGHARITTTAKYVRPAMTDIVTHYQEHLRRRDRPAETVVSMWAYDGADLDELFGNER